MSWNVIRERGGSRKGEHITKLMHKAKEVLEELCEEFEDMEEYFGEREMGGYGEREDYEMRGERGGYGERRGRNGRYMR